MNRSCPTVPTVELSSCVTFDSISPKDEFSVTLGIVAYNTPCLVLRATLFSVTNSSLRPLVVVLCNSPENDYQIAVRQICLELGVKCISNGSNRGFGAGHNQIWRRCETTWYVCCNPDVIVESSSIERLVEFGEANPRACLLMPKVLNSNGSIQPLARQHPTPWRWFLRQLWRLAPRLVRPFELQFDYSRTQPIEFVTGCFFVARLELLKKLGGFDERFFLYAEDADLSRRACRYGQNWYVAESIITHRWAAEWRRSPKAICRNISGLLRLWKKDCVDWKDRIVQNL